MNRYKTAEMANVGLIVLVNVSFMECMFMGKVYWRYQYEIDNTLGL